MVTLDIIYWNQMNHSLSNHHIRYQLTSFCSVVAMVKNGVDSSLSLFSPHTYVQTLEATKRNHRRGCSRIQGIAPCYWDACPITHELATLRFAAFKLANKFLQFMFATSLVSLSSEEYQERHQ
jgi:hypothetical protein